MMSVVSAVTDKVRQMNHGPLHFYKYERLRDRPFDLYVAFLVMFMGSYSFFDPDFPEKLPPFYYWIIVIEDVYLLGAGVALAISLAMKQFGKRIALAYEIEMLAWAFVASAAGVIVLTSPWIPPVAFDTSTPVMVIAWDMLWLGLCVAATTRSLFIRSRILARADRWT